MSNYDRRREDRDAKAAVEEQIKRWGAECDAIDAELLVLRNASAILGDDLLKHSIELWDMKMIRLQRCVIDLQGVVMDVNCERIRKPEMVNGEASALTDGLEVKPCKHCSSERYIIKMLYKGHRNNVAVVECGECGGDTTPVVLDYFMSEAECCTKCREAWNAANETPNA